MRSLLKSKPEPRKSLVLSDTLCCALQTVSEGIFGQAWHQHIVTELRRTRQQGSVPEGAVLNRIIGKLIAEASQHHSDLGRQLVVTENQIVYRPDGRRYTVVFLQGEEREEVVVSWQLFHPKAGVATIKYSVSGMLWRCTEYSVSENYQLDLPLLSKVGGEALGFMADHGLLPEGSPFTEALNAEIELVDIQKQTARESRAS